MKEFKNIVDKPNEELIAIERQLKKGEKQIGVKLLKKGQKLYGLKNGVLAEIPAEAYEEIAIMPDTARAGTTMHRRKLKVDPETYYVVALNQKNALRKLQNYLKVRQFKTKTITLNKKAK